MYYVADCYVRVDKKLLKRGEILPELPEGKIKWLLEAGAIHACEPEPAAAYTMTEKEFTEMLEAVSQDRSDPPFFGESTEEIAEVAETNIEPEEDLEDPEEESEDLEAPVQADGVDEADLPDVPEINAMEGIVIGEEPAKETPAKAEPEKKETAPKKTRTAKPKKEGATK